MNKTIITHDGELLTIAKAFCRKADKDESIFTLIGYYDNVANIMNELIRDGADLIDADIHPEEYDGYCDAYQLSYIPDDGIYVAKMYSEDGECLYSEDDIVLIEEDFVADYLEVNEMPSDFLVFGYRDVHENEEDDKPCLCMDDDNKGFTFCINDENGRIKFRYACDKRISINDAWKIVEEEF